MSKALIVSLILQVIFIWVQDKLPAAFPKRISNYFFKAVAITAVLLTGFQVSVIGLLFEWGAWGVTIVLMVLAVPPPIAGLTENRLRANGNDVFDLKRLPGHLLTNVLGALASTAFVWAALSTPQFDEFNQAFGDEAAFNIALPLATAVAIAFVRSEQERQSGALDLRTASDEVAEPAIVGYSLRHVHQLLNTIFLAAVVFSAGATMLYLFAQTISSAKAGQPLDVSWPVVVSIVLTMLFFLACGLPQSRGSRTVWITFATGTPAVLMISLVWLALFQESALRNATIGLVVGGAYVAYCVECILAERGNGNKIELHYFSSVVVLFVITMLLGAIYLS